MMHRQLARILEKHLPENIMGYCYNNITPMNKCSYDKTKL